MPKGGFFSSKERYLTSIFVNIKHTSLLCKSIKDAEKSFIMFIAMGPIMSFTSVNMSNIVSRYKKESSQYSIKFFKVLNFQL
jgi:hypothetical protein